MTLRFLFFGMVLLLGSCFYRPINTEVPITYKDQYLKFKQPDEVFVDYGYNYMTTKLKNGQRIYRQFYPEKDQLILEYHSTPVSAYKSKMNGPFKSWWDNGELKSEGLMAQDIKVGAWKFYNFKDGYMSRIDSFENGELVVRKNYNEGGKILSSFQFQNGNREGTFIEYDSLGNVANQGVYKADTIFSQTNPRALTKDTLITEGMPRFPGCEDLRDEDGRKMCAQKKMLEFVYGNLRYPVKARQYGVEGMVIAQFVVGKDGLVKDIVYLQGICYPMESAVNSVLSSMPRWIPGEQNGDKIDVLYTLPVRFKLEN